MKWVSEEKEVPSAPFVRFYERKSGLQIKLKRKGLFGRDVCPKNIHKFDRKVG